MMMAIEGNDRDGGEDVETSEAGVGEEALETEELALDEEERLPWLESGDYEDEDESVDTGRVIGFAILGLLALAAIIGGIWYFGNRGSDPDLVADGSTIEAPEGPYKEKPDDPGGQVAEGTGDVAPAVGEGQTREGRLADGNTPESGVDVAGARNSAGTTASSGLSASAASGSGSVGVQVGAYSSRAGAQRGWAKLTRQTSALQGFRYRIQEGQADIGTVYRLQAVTGDAAAARKLCNALKADGVACQVKQ